MRNWNWSKINIKESLKKTISRYIKQKLSIINYYKYRLSYKVDSNAVRLITIMDLYNDND